MGTDIHRLKFHSKLLDMHIVSVIYIDFISNNY